jgi:hypothetical protein
MFCSFGIRCIMFIFFVVCFFQGAMAIDVFFSAEDGGESVSISDEYDVSTSVSVSEESEAKFGNVEMTNSRWVAGSGDANAVQSFSGSSGYFGQADLDASRVSGTLRSTASLTPSAMSASQSGSFAGDSTDSGMSLTSKGNSVAVSSGMTSGTITTSQNIWTGSAEGSQDTQIIGADSGYIDTRGYVIGDTEWTFVRNEITLGEDGKPLGDLIIYKTVSADGTVIFSIDWWPNV